MTGLSERLPLCCRSDSDWLARVRAGGRPVWLSLDARGRVAAGRRIAQRDGDRGQPADGRRQAICGRSFCPASAVAAVLCGATKSSSRRPNRMSRRDPIRRISGPAGPAFGALSRMPVGALPPKPMYRWKVLCLDVEHRQNALGEDRPRGQAHDSDSRQQYLRIRNAGHGRRACHCTLRNGRSVLLRYVGQLLWKKDFDTHPMLFGWGTASSPIAVRRQRLRAMRQR